MTVAMTYLHNGYEVLLLTDELHAQWYVSLSDGTSQKLLTCLGCAHGLRIFDETVDRIRKDKWLN